MYQHAWLRYVLRQPMTNSSLRLRFSIEAKTAAIASRLIRDALHEGVIALEDKDPPRASAVTFRGGRAWNERRLLEVGQGHLTRKCPVARVAREP